MVYHRYSIWHWEIHVRSLTPRSLRDHTNSQSAYLAMWRIPVFHFLRAQLQRTTVLLLRGLALSWYFQEQAVCLGCSQKEQYRPSSRILYFRLLSLVPSWLNFENFKSICFWFTVWRNLQIFHKPWVPQPTQSAAQLWVSHAADSMQAIAKGQMWSQSAFLKLMVLRSPPSRPWCATKAGMTLCESAFGSFNRRQAPL
jgi:hypothetical protein